MQNNATNAYYGSGTSLTNNNNKNNNYAVVPFAMYEMTRERLIEDLVEAYYDCRKNKKSKIDCVKFELRLEDNIVKLAEEIFERRYEVSPSKAFIVNYPVKREIFASDFRDRVVHHYISLRIEPLIEKLFIDDSYNCRKGKGTSYGIARLYSEIDRVSNNWKDTAYCYSIDIEGFFMSIDQDLLWKKVERFIKREYRGNDEEILLYLLKKVVYDKPQNNCIRVCPKDEWIGLKPSKSLFGVKGNKGVSLGKLSSQLLANFYLAVMDIKVKDKVDFYCRYVDDIRLIDKDKARLERAVKLIERNLKGMKLKIHPKKCRVQEVHKGVKFIGAYIMPHRLYITNRVRNKFYNKILCINKQNEDGELDIRKAVATINSYLGMMRCYRTYNIRLGCFSAIDKEIKKLMYGTKHLNSVKLNKEIKNKIRLWQEQELWEQLNLT